jgi:DNA-binding IclR family transcriptional regulator
MSDPDLTIQEEAVLVAMAGAQDEGITQLNIEDLSDRTGLPLHEVAAALYSLRDHGLVSKSGPATDQTKLH